MTNINRSNASSIKQLIDELELLKSLLASERQKNHFLDTLISLIPGHIYWLNTKNEFLGCNNMQAKTAQLGSRDDIVGKTNFDMPWKEQAAALDQINNLVITTGQPQIREETIDTAEGEKTYLSHKEPLRNDNKEIIGILGVSLDISNIKKLESELRHAKELAEAASQAKSEFLDNMRHDIRTPLTGIIGFAELLKMESDNPHIKDYSENLVASSHALLDLLDEVLEAVRVSSGEIPLLKKKFCLEHILNQVIELNRARALEKKLKLTLNIDKAIPKYVIGDKIRLHRLALELIGNALNFTDSGFVTLSVLLAKRDDGKLVIKLIVEDSGIGIPKDKQQDIYLQFKRLTPSYQGIYKGAGLGLFVVKQFIDELGGEIYVDSEVRRGTTFTCLIPLQEPLLDDATGIDSELDQLIDKPLEISYAQEIKSTTKPKQNNDFRVLVVEDNLIAQTVAQSILAKLRCDVECANTGRTAIERWQSCQYDLIFMDIGLPDLDGYEVTHQIRLLELTQKTHTPIIALTAHAGDENKKRCIEAGMNAVLTKPLTAQSCTDILEAFIPGYRQPNTMNASEQLAHADLPQSDDSLFDLTPYPILDLDEGIKTTGTIDVLAQMLRFMIEDSLDSDVLLMKQAHDELDWEKTQQLAHKIKGGAVYVGTVKMKMACQYLERYWKSGQRDLMEPLYQQTLTVIDESIQGITLWLQSH